MIVFYLCMTGTPLDHGQDGLVNTLRMDAMADATIKKYAQSASFLAKKDDPLLNRQPSSPVLSMRMSQSLLLNVDFCLPGSSPDGLLFLAAPCSGIKLSCFASQFAISDVSHTF
jgi:hypothetical protein